MSARDRPAARYSSVGERSESAWHAIADAFDVAPVPAVIMASDGTPLAGNGTFCRLVGADSGSASSLLDVDHADDRDGVARLLRRSHRPTVQTLDARIVVREAVIPVQLLVASVDGADTVLVQFLDLRPQLQREAELIKVAHLDELTGLLNRRGFNVAAGHLLEVARRHGSSVSFLFIDVDGLKAINDERGHVAGDEAIRVAAALLREAFRTADALCRFGGDEFCVLAITRSARSGSDLRDRLTSMVRAYNRSATAAPLSLSIGLVHREPEALRGVALTTLIDEADRAMYADRRRARRSG